MARLAQSSGDSGSGEFGVTLPGIGATSGSVTVHHTVLILLVCLVALWLLGGVAFKSIRM